MRVLWDFRPSCTCTIFLASRVGAVFVLYLCLASLVRDVYVLYKSVNWNVIFVLGVPRHISRNARPCVHCLNAFPSNVGGLN